MNAFPQRRPRPRHRGGGCHLFVLAPMALLSQLPLILGLMLR